MIHLQGELVLYDDGISLKGEADCLGVQIAELLEDTDIEHSIKIPEVQFRFYVTDKEGSLVEVQEQYLIQCLGGEMILETDWYGYSEYTIEGYNTKEFKIGKHDIEQILSQYIGKYVHILIDVIYRP